MSRPAKDPTGDLLASSRHVGRKKNIRHSRKIAVAVPVALWVLALVPLGGALSDDGGAGARAQAVAQADEVVAQAEQAEQDLQDRHRSLQNQVSAADVDRVQADRSALRSLVLDLSGTSASTQSVEVLRERLPRRQPALAGSGARQVMTDFLPEWLGTARPASGGQAYALGALEVDLVGIAGQEYAYVAMADLEPVTSGAGSTLQGQHLVLRVVTDSAGSISAVSAQRVSSASREELMEQRRDDPSPPGPVDERSVSSTTETS